MRTRYWLPALALTAAVAACGDGQANNQAAGPPPLDRTQNEMLAMAEPLRNGVLVRAIVDAQEQCSRVERSEARGVVNDMPLFVAYCDNGRAFTVSIRPGGSAAVARGVPAQ